MKKKLLCGTLALAMVASLFATSMPAVNAEYTVNDGILNWNFTDATKVENYAGLKAPIGWNVETGVDFEFEADIVAGDALKLDFDKNATQNSDSAWFGYWQTVKVEPYTYYEFSYWAKRNENAINNGNITSAVVAETGNHSSRLLTLDATHPVIDGWCKYTGTFYSGGRLSVDIMLNSYEVGGNYTGMVAWIDYIELKQVTAAEANVVVNGNMEEWISGSPFRWNLWTAGSVVEEQDGTNSFATYTPDSVPLTNLINEISLKPNTEYQLSLKYKSNYADVWVEPAVTRDRTAVDQNFIDTSHAWLNATAANTWHSATVRFNSGNSTDVWLLLRFYKEGVVATTDYTFSFDDVIISEVAADPNNLVTNADFETWANDTSATNWNPWTAGTTGAKIVGRNGAGFAAEYTASSSVGQNIVAQMAPTLKANTTYEFSFWSKSDHTAADSAWIKAFVTGAVETASAIEYSPATANTWVKNTKYFTVGDADVSGAVIYLTFYKYSGGWATSDYKFAFDDLTIKEHVCTSFDYVNNADSTHTATCVQCGQVQTPQAHNYTASSLPLSPTCMEQGKQHNFCSVCGGYEVAQLLALADVKGDGNVNSTDLILMKKYITGLSNSLAAGTGDLNHDGVCNNEDIIILRANFIL